MEWTVKVAEHAVALQFGAGDIVEMLFDAGREAIIDDRLKMIGQKVGDQFTGWCRHKFAPVGAGFFGDDNFVTQPQTSDVLCGV